MTEGLSITRTFAASRELVYAAWTTPEQFAAWFGTDAIPVDAVTMDVRVGGLWTAIMHLPDGNDMNWAGEYTVVDPPTALVLTITDDPSLTVREYVSVLLDEAEGGTRMTMTQTGGNLTEDQYTQTAVGYNGFFDSMERLLAEH